MRILCLAAVVALAAPAPAGETKLGAGVTLKESTAISAIVKAPEAYVGKTIRVDGVATAICTSMGCWMALASEADPKGPVVRLKVEDGAIVFPVSAKGKRVSAQGLFEAIGHDDHGKEAAGEHAKQDAKASASYQLNASGAIIK